MPDNITSLSFEEALSELEKIVRGLESGQMKLEDAIAAYERGAAPVPYTHLTLPTIYPV